MDRIAQAIQLAILDAGANSCTCNACQMLLLVQRELREGLRRNLAAETP